MARYAGPTSDPASRFTLRQAWALAKAACMARARQRGVRYPMPYAIVTGIPPSDLKTNPDKYGTHYLTGPRETAVRGEYLLEVTAEMEALPEGTERVDGEDVEVTRVGVERSRNTFPDDDLVLAER